MFFVFGIPVAVACAVLVRPGPSSPLRHEIARCLLSGGLALGACVVFGSLVVSEPATSRLGR
ncbi:MAG: hypothetical protein R2697_09025 [Ilumatobacteraceae bacterium]